MKSCKSFLIVFIINCLLSNVIAQKPVYGKTDEKGLRQGWCKLEFTKHPLIPIHTGKVIIYSLGNYVNDTLQGDFYVYTKDSISYVVKLNSVNGLKSGFGYYFQEKKIRETYYFVNDTLNFIHEFDNKGKVLRVYQSAALKSSELIFIGERFDFRNGKLLYDRMYDSKGKIIKEVTY